MRADIASQPTGDSVEEICSELLRRDSRQSPGRRRIRFILQMSDCPINRQLRS